MRLVSLGASPGSTVQILERTGPPVADSKSLTTFGERLVSTWHNLIASNTTLFLILISVNAWALPYGGIVHDARLYGLQVVNRLEGGSFAGDLYLQFGSQDRFSSFSTLAAPLVRTLGLDPAFFIIYLTSIAILLWGTQRLVLELCRDRMLASISLVLLATTPMAFAGLATFHVNETFVTPRLAANGLVLWALALLLENKPIKSSLLILFALALHPLMACSGLLVCITYYASSRFTKWHLLALAGVLAAGGILLCSDALASRFLGRMDGAWREAVRRACPYNFPAEWTGEDWAYILSALGIALAACAGPLRGSTQMRLMACVAAVAAAGLGIHSAGCQLPFALPFQGQGYRWLWLLQCLQIPCGILLISGWWQQRTLATHISAVVLAAFLGSTLDRLEFLALLPSLAAFSFYLKSPPESSRRRLGIILGGLGIAWLIWHEVWALHAYWSEVIPSIELFEYLRTAPRSLLRASRVSLAIAAVISLAWFVSKRRTVGYALAAVAILLQTISFDAGWAERTTRRTATVSMVRDYLNKAGNSSHPAIYWPNGWVECLWFDLHADSYFNSVQVAGNIYSRENAMEGLRRMELVERFELARIRELSQFYSPLQLEQALAEFKGSLSEPDPSWADVEALCNDPKVDYLLLTRDFAGRSVATDGTWHLYDCQAIREGRTPRTDRPARFNN